MSLDVLDKLARPWVWAAPGSMSNTHRRLILNFTEAWCERRWSPTEGGLNGRGVQMTRTVTKACPGGPIGWLSCSVCGAHRSADKGSLTTPTLNPGKWGKQSHHLYTKRKQRRREREKERERPRARNHKEAEDVNPQCSTMVLISGRDPTWRCWGSRSRHKAERKPAFMQWETRGKA